MGIYTLNHSTFELLLTAGEEHFRRAMLFSDNDLSTFLTHPVSATLVAITVILLVLSALPAIRRTRHILE